MKKQLFDSYDTLISTENLLQAWREFTLGKSSKKDVQDFALHFADHIVQLHTELASFRYRHGLYQAFTISDPKPRHIHKARVRDRVLHHAVYRILYPFFDRTFINDSYSCRLGKGMHKAQEYFRRYAGIVSSNYTRTCWVLKCDIRKFFASIDHDILVTLLTQHIPDLGILLLLEEIIDSFKTSPGKGLPLGNLTSQLFCNVYMNKFDQYIKHELKARILYPVC
jgi:RNA-directed DNA polymerase